MEPTSFQEFDRHESLTLVKSKNSGLRAAIAVHSTALGPATGGTRIFAYRTFGDAVRDSLRLSRAMSYKCALAGVPFGGGKGVIMANGGNRRLMLKEYAAVLNQLGGSFSTGEDVGIGHADVGYMARYSPHVNGVRGAKNPQFSAASGVFHAMKAALRHVYGNDDFEGRLVGIKGLGKVGAELAALVHGAGGSILAADIDKERVSKMSKKFRRLTPVSPGAITAAKLDVYAPCALGLEFDRNTSKKVRSSVICGAANNQLDSPRIAEYFAKRGILYVPDFVANAGALIDLMSEREVRGYDHAKVERKIVAIGTTVSTIIKAAEKTGDSTDSIARKMAEKIILSAR